MNLIQSSQGTDKFHVLINRNTNLNKTTDFFFKQTRIQMSQAHTQAQQRMAEFAIVENVPHFSSC